MISSLTGSLLVGSHGEHLSCYNNFKIFEIAIFYYLSSKHSRMKHHVICSGMKDITERRKGIK